MIGASTEVNDETSDNETGDENHWSHEREYFLIRRVHSDLHLMIEKKNSASPNHRTPKMLIMHTRTAMRAV